MDKAYHYAKRKEWLKKPGNREKLRIWQKGYTTKYRLNPKNRIKRNARKRVEYALEVGKIKKSPCWCGKRKVEAHHPDYSKPLEVIWLCKPHHSNV